MGAVLERSEDAPALRYVHLPGRLQLNDTGGVLLVAVRLLLASELEIAGRGGDMLE